MTVPRDASGIRVLIVDDDPFVRSALRMILDHAPDIVVVEEAAHGAAALAVLDVQEVDVVVTDLVMPGTSGLDLLRTLAGVGQSPPVVVLTNHVGEADVVAALTAGALGYVDKSGDPTLTVEAVRRAASGDSVFSAEVVSTIVEPLRRGASSPSRSPHWAADLTRREREVAVSVSQGLSNDEIAGRLHLSLSTVKTNVSRVLNKLRMSNRVQISMLVHGVTVENSPAEPFKEMPRPGTYPVPPGRLGPTTAPGGDPKRASR